MKRFLISLLIALGAISSLCAQENQINRIPTVGNDPDQHQYITDDRGFWIAAELLGGVSTHLNGHNMGIGELDVTAGYRFSQFLKFGVGLGARYYIDQKHLRRHNSSWGMPLFIAARGNMMGERYRRVVPYWGAELGGSIRDGFMLRPTVGIRVGETRQAFTLGFSYMGQSVATLTREGKKANHFTSFFCLRAGFEF